MEKASKSAQSDPVCVNTDRDCTIVENVSKSAQSDPICVNTDRDCTIVKKVSKSAQSATPCVNIDRDCTIRPLGATASEKASLSGTFLQTLPDLVRPPEGALSIFAQLSSDAVSALRKVWVLIRLWNN